MSPLFRAAWLLALAVLLAGCDRLLSYQSTMPDHASQIPGLDGSGQVGLDRPADQAAPADLPCLERTDQPTGIDRPRAETGPDLVREVGPTLDHALAEHAPADHALVDHAPVDHRRTEPVPVDHALSDRGPCGPWNCTGCCQKGLCWFGTSSDRCGAGGNTCVSCPSSTDCTSSSCVAGTCKVVNVPDGYLCGLLQECCAGQCCNSCCNGQCCGNDCCDSHGNCCQSICTFVGCL